MRILLCASDFPPDIGGIQTYSYEVAKNLFALGQEVIVLAPRTKGADEFDCRQDFRVIRIREKICLYPLFFWSLIRFKIDGVFITQRADYASLAFWSKKIFGIPYYVKTHGREFLLPWKIRSIRKNLKGADRIIAVSNFTKGELLKLQIPDDNIVVMPDGVDLIKFNPKLDPQSIISRYELRDRKVILTVSRLVKRKGHSSVIRTLPEVLKKVPRVIYLIVGEGPEENALRRLAHDLGIDDRIVFAGRVSSEELPFYYNACDVFIMPNYEIKEARDVEGFGIVFLEANACGKPVIGGRSGGVEDAIVEGKTGLLVDPLSREEIAGALISLLTDEKLAKELGRKGRERVEKELNWRTISRRILAELKP